MNVLITGGTGFIGSRLALECLERGHGVKVLGQENTQAESHNSRYWSGNGRRHIGRLATFGGGSKAPARDG